MTYREALAKAERQLQLAEAGLSVTKDIPATRVDIARAYMALARLLNEGETRGGYRQA